MNHEDTICAVSTPPGEGGIGIIRVSGNDALAITGALFRPRRDKQFKDVATHTLHYGQIVDPSTRRACG